MGTGTALYVPALLQQTLMHFVTHPAFHRRQIPLVEQFTQRDIYDLFSLAHEMRLEVSVLKRYGGDVVSILAEQSNVKKDETLQDTIQPSPVSGSRMRCHRCAILAAKYSPRFKCGRRHRQASCSGAPGCVHDTL
jgi:hypothetical protein